MGTAGSPLGLEELEELLGNQEIAQVAATPIIAIVPRM